MILITGMHRSGTSCITGLLEKCGFSTGSPLEVQQVKNEWNAKGYFENLLMWSINDTVLIHAGGQWNIPPAQQNIDNVAPRASAHFDRFRREFSGEIAKDPRCCLTINYWETYTAVSKVVFCLRNPIAVAESLHKRDSMPFEQSIALWFEYTSRFFKNHISTVPLVICDYDNLSTHFEFEFHSLVKALGRYLSLEEIKARTKGFYDPSMNHANVNRRNLKDLPQPVMLLYETVKKHTFEALQNKSNQSLDSESDT